MAGSEAQKGEGARETKRDGETEDSRRSWKLCAHPDKGTPGLARILRTRVCLRAGAREKGATNRRREEGFIAQDLLLLPGGAVQFRLLVLSLSLHPTLIHIVTFLSFRLSSCSILYISYSHYKFLRSPKHVRSILSLTIHLTFFLLFPFLYPILVFAFTRPFTARPRYPSLYLVHTYCSMCLVKWCKTSSHCRLKTAFIYFPIAFIVGYCSLSLSLSLSLSPSLNK
jgi:hypothetical protein